MEGDINFFVARSFANHWRAYMNPQVPRNSMIFNELFLNFHEELVVVEGVFDAVNAGCNAVPLLGSTLSEESKLLQKIVKYDTPVYVALDHDAEKKSIWIIKKLLQYGIEVFKVDTSGFKDVGEMNKNQFNNRKQNAVSINSENVLLYEAMIV
jgi:DNA primase